MLEGGKKSKVLIVDDTPENIQVLMGTLKDQYAIVAAINGEKALKMASADPKPDLILLDIMMPGMDGFEVCRRLKADPATRKIPVIFLSALDKAADKVLGLQLGAVDYVAKPFQPEEVVARVNTHLTIQRLSIEVQQHRDELEHELLAVSQLQRNFLPERLPQLDGMKLAVHYQTSRYAGGDYYDFAELPDGRLAILVADAEGHSAPATVMMAITCALFRSCSNQLQEPDQMISFINENLCKVNKESFVTAIYGVYDTRNRTLRIARAGHSPPILYRSSKKRAVEIPCDGVPVMGWGPCPHVPVTEIEIERGDRVLFYTDGITERFSEQDELYGQSRLLKQFENSQGDDPAEILEQIMGAVEGFAGTRPSDDDQAMLLIVAE